MTTQTKECRMSKQGWPLGIYSHNLGMAYTATFAELKKLIHLRYGLHSSNFPQPSDPRYSDVHILARLSLERYGQIRAFVDGFRAGQVAG